MSFLKRIWRLRILGASLGGAAVLFVAGIVFWGGFNTAMEATNTMTFCISCHEMEENVYQEYKHTVHYQNRSGVQATCSDCHVPDPWVHKVVRKIKASNELFHKVAGTVSTPEKFEARRLTLAKRVWATMKETDSRECRNCHSWDAMTSEAQRKRAWKMHTVAQEDGQTCIDCHKGIAHRDVSVLLGPDDDPYDGKPDPRRLPPKEEKQDSEKAAPVASDQSPDATVTTAAATGAGTVATSAETADAGESGGGIDWDAIPATEVTLLYPGQTSWEWVLQGSDHGGARIFKKGDSCSGCHEGEQADMGAKMASGEKAEPTPIPGKRPAIPLSVQAAYDDQNLYMRFAWPAGEHAPAPFADGGKMDPANEVKLAMMIDAGAVEAAERSGCWSTCHHDARSMPDSPDGQEVTKYLPQTRTGLEIRGGDGKPRGGWDKLKPEDEIAALMQRGAFLDLLRFNAGDGSGEDGYVLAERVMEDEGPGVTFTGGKEGDQWVVTMTRPLGQGGPGDHALEEGKLYTVGFAIHDDFTDARFHHVSIDYSLAIGEIGDEADIVAARR